MQLLLLASELWPDKVGCRYITARGQRAWPLHALCMSALRDGMACVCGAENLDT